MHYNETIAVQYTKKKNHQTRNQDCDNRYKQKKLVSIGNCMVKCTVRLGPLNSIIIARIVKSM